MSRKLLFVVLTASLVAMASQSRAQGQREAEAQGTPAALNFKMTTLAGKEVALDKYLGQVVLIVNVASQCGLTPQYEQLQALHKRYSQRGLAVTGFPCNQFGQQEPGTASEMPTRTPG